jgi:hypothetical protein
MYGRTFCFEFYETLGGDQRLIISALQKCENLGLTYYKHVQYVLGLCVKHVGILQFKDRVSDCGLRRIFADERIHLEILTIVGKPMILPHMKIWILAKHHGVGGVVNEEGVFSFGGKLLTAASKSAQLENFMRPYIVLLNFYIDSGTRDVETEKIENIKQLLGYFDALARLQWEYI